MNYVVSGSTRFWASVLALITFILLIDLLLPLITHANTTLGAVLSAGLVLVFVQWALAYGDHLTLRRRVNFDPANIEATYHSTIKRDPNKVFVPEPGTPMEEGPPPERGEGLPLSAEELKSRSFREARDKHYANEFAVAFQMMNGAGAGASTSSSASSTNSNQQNKPTEQTDTQKL